ncbi:TolC family protein [uncultured Flavobacterium sp.]|uniref:TolC family protein n=1 Tax=uncultured Flavobacterium sp. TaxID=165435 RepID=UPI003081D3ED
MIHKVIAISFLFAFSFGFCQNKTVDQYIQLGFKNNLGLKQQNLNLKQSFDNLKIAKGIFYPTLKFQSDYTYASGGRNIVLPLGDLLNPAYNSLNQLNGNTNFKNINNQEFNLSANDYYDTRLNVMLSLVDAEMILNKNIKKEAINQKEAEVAVYKRGLVRDIKVAYYNIAMIKNQIKIFNNADKLLQDNYKITQSRFKNGKVLQGDVLRIHSDINDNNAKKTEAQNRLKTAFAYLNFIINEDLIKEVKIDTTGFKQSQVSISEAEFKSNEREEITALRSSLEQSSLMVKSKKAAYLPVVNTFLNAGFQSTYLLFNTDTRYLFGGVTLKWNIFSGFQNKNKISIAKSDVSILDAKITESTKQFEYQKKLGENDLNSAEARLQSSAENIVFLEEYYRETKSRYDQGMVLLVEINDAFTQLIDGRLNYELANTAVLIKKAEVERTTASYILNQ